MKNKRPFFKRLASKKAVYFYLIVLALALIGAAVINFFGRSIWYAAAERASRNVFMGPAGTWWGPLVRTAMVNGTTAYIGMGTEMGVLDLADPANPRLIKKMYIGGIAHGFCGSGSTMFLAAGPSGLTSFDISDPQNPRRLDRFSNFGYGMHCAVKDNLLLFSNEMSGWVMLDVSDPAHMRPLADLDGGWVSAATIKDNIAYVLDGRRGVEIFDISTPSAPRRITNVPIQLPPEIYEPDPPPIWLELEGDYAYVSNGSDGLRVIHVKDPSHPTVVGHLPLQGYTYTIAVRGDRAWIANINLGLLVVDISDPTHPRLINTCTTPGGAYDVILRGDQAYVSDGANGFLILDISDRDMPRPTGYYQVPPFTRGVTLAGHLLISANESAGLNLFDVADPWRPKLLSVMDTKGLASQTAVYGDRLIVADVLAGAHMVDIQDPAHPRLLSTFIPEDHPWAITVDGGHGYVANGHHGFSVLDLRPEIPVHLANDYTRMGNTFGYLIRVAESDGIAIATNISTGAFIYDVSDPAQPVRKAFFEDSESLLHSLFKYLRYGMYVRPIIGAAVRKSTAFLAAYDQGLIVLNLENLSRPKIEAKVPTAGHAYGVAIKDNRLVLTEYEGLVTLFDISEPSRPKKIKAWKLEGQLCDATLDERYLYIAAGAQGTAIVNMNSNDVTYLPIVPGKFEMLTCQNL